MQDIELTRLCDLPEDEAVSVEEFVSVTERTCQESAESLSKYVSLHEIFAMSNKGKPHQE